MYENIFEALEEWSYALLYEDKEKEREAGRKIEEFRRAYREGKLIEGKPKIVGTFSSGMCSIHLDGVHFATIFNLKYTGVGSDIDGKRMYTNQDTNIWLDYAVYE